MTDQELLANCRYRLEQIQRCLEKDDVNTSVYRLAQRTLSVAHDSLRIWYEFAQPLVAADHIVKAEYQKPHSAPIPVIKVLYCPRHGRVTAHSPQGCLLCVSEGGAE